MRVELGGGWRRERAGGEAMNPDEQSFSMCQTVHVALRFFQEKDW
jgi:hypothetical protein